MSLTMGGPDLELDEYDDSDYDEYEVERPGRLHNLLWGDKSAKEDKAKPKRRRDPALPGLYRVRALRALLVLLLLVGAVGGAKALLTSAPPPGPTAAEIAEMTTIDVPRDVGVGGFAELYVSAWLTAGRTTSSVIAPYYPTQVDFNQVNSGAFWAARTATIDVIEQGDSYWAVTVAADVLSNNEGAYEAAGIRFYTFGVIKTDDGFVATTLPAQVPAPPTLDLPELVIEFLNAPTSAEIEPIAEALGGFFRALLAGAGDIERYVRPNTHLAPISPAPFATIDVRSLGARPEVEDPNRLLVRVEIRATDTAGNAQVMQYTVTVAQRAERWEVVELVAASPIGTGADAGS